MRGRWRRLFGIPSFLIFGPRYPGNVDPDLRPDTTYKNSVSALHDSTETLFAPLRYTQPVRAHILTRRGTWQPVREADTAKPPARALKAQCTGRSAAR